MIREPPADVGSRAVGAERGPTRSPCRRRSSAFGEPGDPDSSCVNSIGITNFVDADWPICLSASRYCRLIVLLSTPCADS